MSRDKLSLTHKITALEGDDLTLRDVRDGGNRTIRMSRSVAEGAEEAPEETAPAEGGEDFVVVDE